MQTKKNKQKTTILQHIMNFEISVIKNDIDLNAKNCTKI